LKKINRGNIFGFYFYQKQLIFTVFGPKTWFFKTSLKRLILTLFLGFFKPKITQKIFGNRIFLINSIRAFDWCMNCQILLRKKFGAFSPTGGTLTKKKVKIFFLTRYDNSYTTRYTLSSLVEKCCFHIFLDWYLHKKSIKTVLT
jgi:hypothetical protein